VRLNCRDALVRIALERVATQVGVRIDGRNEGGDLRGIVRIANIGGAHTCVELRGEDDFLVEGRPELLVRRVWPEASTAIAEASASGGDLIRSDRLGTGFVRRVYGEAQMPDLIEAEVCRRLGSNEHDIANGSQIRI